MQITFASSIDQDASLVIPVYLSINDVFGVVQENKNKPIIPNMLVNVRLRVQNDHICQTGHLWKVMRKGEQIGPVQEITIDLPLLLAIGQSTHNGFMLLCSGQSRVQAHLVLEYAVHLRSI